MTRLCLLFLLAFLLLWATPARAEKAFTLVWTGDMMGELEPCG